MAVTHLPSQMTLNWHYLQERLINTDVDTLITECEKQQKQKSLMDEERYATQLIHSALILSAYALRTDKSALAHQLVGRLIPHKNKNSLIKSLIDDIIQLPNHLFSIHSNDDFAPLLPAGWSLANRFRHKASVEGFIQTRNGRFLSWNYDFNFYLWSKDGKLLSLMKKHRKEPIRGIELHDGTLLTIGVMPFDAVAELFLWDKDGHFLRTISLDEYNLIVPPHKKRRLPDEIKVRGGKYIATWERHDIFLWHKDKPRTITAQHPGMVSIEQTQDGLIISNAHDEHPSVLCLWDWNGNLVNTGQVHTNAIIGVYQTSDGRFFSWGRDKKVCLWDSRLNLIKICHDDLNITNVVETREGQFITRGAGYYHQGNDKSLRLWDKDGNLIKTLQGNSREIEGMFQTTQGYYLAWESGNEEGFNLYLWDIDANLVKVMAGHTGHIRCVIEARDGRILSCGVDAKIHIWDKDGNLQNIMTGHDKQITDLKQLKNDLFVSSDTSDITIIWDETGNLIKKLGKKRDDIGSVIMLDDNRYVSFTWHKFFLWDADWNLLDTLETFLYGDKKPIWAWANKNHIDPMVFYSGDLVIGDYRLTAYWRWHIQIYNPETGETIHTFYADAMFRTKPIIISQDNAFIVIIGDEKGRILFLRWQPS